MKALAYEDAHALHAFAMDLLDVAEPGLRDRDLPIEIHAVGVDPGEAHMRATRSAEPGGRLVLGWEFAGVVIGSGSAVTGFTPGDRVMGTGHSEMVFSQIVSGADPSNQARILQSIIGHVVAGRVGPIVTTQLDGLSARSMKTAQKLLETRRTVGKIVIAT
jgi:NADPH:quinone reductase-like Zn-dependent oxidoreductase